VVRRDEERPCGADRGRGGDRAHFGVNLDFAPLDDHLASAARGDDVSCGTTIAPAHHAAGTGTHHPADHATGASADHDADHGTAAADHDHDGPECRWGRSRVLTAGYPPPREEC
jgi:hypothetical protein